MKTTFILFYFNQRLFTVGIKRLGSRDLLEVQLPKKKPTFHSAPRIALCLRILQAQNDDAQVSYGKYAFHPKFEVGNLHHNGACLKDIDNPNQQKGPFWWRP